MSPPSFTLYAFTCTTFILLPASLIMYLLTHIIFNCEPSIFIHIDLYFTHFQQLHLNGWFCVYWHEKDKWQIKYVKPSVLLKNNLIGLSNLAGFYSLHFKYLIKNKYGLKILEFLLLLPLLQTYKKGLDNHDYCPV